MRPLLLFALAASLLPACRQAEAPPATPRPQPAPSAAPQAEVAPHPPVVAPSPITALVGGTVFDATGGPPLADATVLLHADRIQAVGPSAELPVPPGARVVDVTGKWLIPGLIDSHIHFFQSAGLYTRPDIVDLRHVRPYEEEAAAIQERLPGTFRRWLASGVTAVVDVGGPFFNFDIRREAAKTALAPRVAVAGPLVSTVNRPQLDIGDPPIIGMETPEAARALVRRQLARRPDLIKIWFIVRPERGLAATIDIVRATIDEAHRGGVRVAVHATELETARASVEAGAEILVHSVHDRVVDPAFVALLAERKVIYSPTLTVMQGYAEVLAGETKLTDLERRYGDPKVVASWGELAAAGTVSGLDKLRARREQWEARDPIMRDNLLTLHRAGVRVAAGTDAGNIGTLHGPSFHHELGQMAAAGMSARDVLLSATSGAARVFAAEPEIGTLEPGKLADLLVLDADPLTSVANLQRIHRVVKGGVVLAPADILPPNPAWVVQRQVEAYNARDLEGFLGWYARDARLLGLPSGKLLAEGHDALRTTYGKLFAASPKLHCSVLSRIVEDDVVVDHELVRGLRDRPVLRAVAAYEVGDGLIRNVWFLPGR